jgi:2-polyprenyl-3-methyl-5-hydroxy-6-metoxy-1,4-benzoquinol methylase
MGILLVSRGSVQFADDHDHWRKGFCRLLEIEESQAREFIENTIRSAEKIFGRNLCNLGEEEKITCLFQAVNETFYKGMRKEIEAQEDIDFSDLRGPEGEVADKIFAHSISGNTEYMVIGNEIEEFAWLVDAKNKKPVTADSITYDEKYFEPLENKHYGMKEYTHQTEWRLEKARRIMDVVVANAGTRGERWTKKPSAVKMLDVGSGIGYFRQAAQTLGFEHHGIDLSENIIKQCKDTFGFETWQGRVEDLRKIAAGKQFQLITMFDVIEHLEKPRSVVTMLKEFLAEDGTLVIRTPNLAAQEAEILGDYYYSFKLDHVRYFSANSLNEMMHGVKMKSVFSETASHLFKGILGADYLFKLGQSRRGADILALYEHA